MKAVILKADGTAPHVENVKGDLESIKAVVEGWIERVPSLNESTERRVVVYANEEGRIHGLPPNRNMLAIQALDLVVSGYIAGNLIVLGKDGHDETDVPEDIIDLLVTPTETGGTDEW